MDTLFRNLAVLVLFCSLLVISLPSFSIASGGDKDKPVAELYVTSW